MLRDVSEQCPTPLTTMSLPELQPSATTNSSPFVALSTTPPEGTVTGSGMNMGNSPFSLGTSQIPGVAPSSQGVLWLLLPHLSLALVILTLLFADFLLYRRRVRFQQKRVFDKQELMETFPRRVIAGLHRNVPSSVNATPLHTPNHTSQAPTKETSATAEPSETPVVKPPQRKQPKKKLKQQVFRSFTVATMGSADLTTVTADKQPPNGVPAASRRRLEKRESCRKLPPIPDSRGSVTANGFVQKEEKRLSPLPVEGEQEDVSVA